MTDLDKETRDRNPDDTSTGSSCSMPGSARQEAGPAGSAGVSGTTGSVSGTGRAGGTSGINAGGAFGQSADRVNIDYDAEEAYWSENYPERPYATENASYEMYQPAYRYGIESYSRFRGRQFGEVEDDLRSGWDRFRDKAELTWEKAKDAVRDAYDRLFDRDSRFSGSTPRSGTR